MYLVFCTEKAIAPHSSTLAWRVPWMEEPGGQQSMGSLRVGHDWVTSLSLFTFMHWRRKWQPTPVFMPGESQGWGSPVGCRLWGRTELDTTEWLHFHNLLDFCDITLYYDPYFKDFRVLHIFYSQTSFKVKLTKNYSLPPSFFLVMGLL